MKKGILTSLVVSAVLLTSAAAYAEPSVDSGKVTASAVVSQAPLFQPEVSGTVEEMSENEMVVKDENGITYRVPLDKFLKLEGFSDLGLAVGTEVSMKRAGFQMLDLESVKSIAGVKLENYSVDGSGLKVLEAGSIGLDEKSGAVLTKADGQVPVLTFVQGNVEIVAADGSKLEMPEGTATPVDGKTLANLSSVPAFSFTLASGVDFAGELSEIKTIDAGSIQLNNMTGTAVTLSASEVPFIAGEITANGKTVKLEQ